MKMGNIIRILALVVVCTLAAALGAQISARKDVADNVNYIKTAHEINTSPVISYEPFFLLTDSEQNLVERVVMAEAGGEPYEGQIAVAQCILNACEKEDKRPGEIIKIYKYSTNRPNPSESVKTAVRAVFRDGIKVTDEPILYFYNPEKVTSVWHESQMYVLTVGNHRFFKEAKK